MPHIIALLGDDNWTVIAELPIFPTESYYYAQLNIVISGKVSTFNISVTERDIVPSIFLFDRRQSR